jgi:hypothetical protein
MPDAQLTASRVQRLYLEQAHGRTVTTADWTHAQHADQCPICDDNADGFNHLEQQLHAAEAARGILAAGILRLLHHQRDVRTTRSCEPLTMQQLEKQLDNLRLRAHRAWKHGSRS